MGRVKLIETPERLLEIFNEYKSDVVYPTKDGFRLFCKENYACAKHYFDNPNNRYKDYIDVCKIITNNINDALLENYKKGSISHSYVIRNPDYIKNDIPISNIKNEDQFLIENGILTINKKYLKPQKKHNLSHKNIIDGIYVIKISGSNIYKIGVSGNVNRRLHDIRASNPFNIELVHFQKCLFALELENEIHCLLKDNHIKNEWFVVDDIETYLNIIKNN